MEPRKVIMVTPEYYGHTMIGGLAMAVSGFAKALALNGTEVHVLMPCYAKTGYAEKFSKEPFATTTEVNITSEERDGVFLHHLHGFNLGSPYTYGVYDKRFSSENLPEVDSAVYRRTDRNVFQAYHRFAAAVSDVLGDGRIGFSARNLKDADLIHLHEWTTAGAAYWLRTFSYYHNKPILVTVHNANYCGNVPDMTQPETDIPEHSPFNSMIKSCLGDNSGNIFTSLLEMGVFYADAVNTVSATEAADIVNGRRTGVDPRLVELFKRKGLEGILNGVDNSLMDPRTDTMITRYDPTNYESLVRGKKENREKLKEVMNARDSNGRKLQLDPSKMLVTMMSRLVDQKGIYEVLEVARNINKLDGTQLLIVGEPVEHSIRTRVEGFYGSFGNGAHGYPWFAGPELQHLVLGASDAILMPSRFEPCGYTQLEGMRYGDVPITTMVGGLKETMKVFDGENGYGFVILEQSPAGIMSALSQANIAFRNKSLWRTATKNAASEDFSWQGPRNPLGKYLELYSRIMKARKA